MSGQSPVVDTRSTSLSASYSKEALDKIPTARDPWVILEQTPGMIVSGSNVGGNLSGQQTSFNALGSGANQQWNIDGAVISDIASGQLVADLLRLRFVRRNPDHQFDIAQEASISANRILPDLLPAITFVGADSGARFNDISPRIGFTYDLLGDGKTVLKANSARYFGLGMSTADTLEPTGATTLRYAWRDLNGDTVIQRNELDFAKAFLTTPTSNYDPTNPTAVTTPAKVDPNLKNDITDEVIAGVDRELMANFGVGVMYIHRKYHQFLGTYRSDPRDVTSAYAPVMFSVNCGNTVNGALTCPQASYSGIYWQRPNALQPATLYRNNTQYNTYDGLELTARKRLANRWMMTGSLVYNRQRHFERNANTDYLDPTNHAPVDLISGYESASRNGAWVAKLNGLYVSPWNINVAGNFNAHTSFPFNPYILSPNRTGSGGTVNVLLQGTNTLRYDTLYQLDLHVDKTVSFGGPRRISLNADLFNVMNNNVVLSREDRQNRTTANNILNLLAPRVARFGVKLNF